MVLPPQDGQGKIQPTEFAENTRVRGAPAWARAANKVAHPARASRRKTWRTYLFTYSLSSLPGRKKGSFLGWTSTTSPVLGLRPVYPP